MSVKTRTEPIENLRDEWTALLSRSDKNNLFLTWEWIYSWCQNMLKPSMIPFIITVRDRNRLTGLAPLVLLPVEGEKYKVQFIGQQYSYHLGFIAKEKREKNVYKALWDYLTNYKTSDIHSIDFLHFDKDECFESVLVSLQKSRKLGFVRSNQNPCKVIYLNGSFDDYYHNQITSKKLIRNIRQENNRMYKNHHICFFDADYDNYSFYWKQMITFHRELMDKRKVHSAIKRDDFTSHLKHIALDFILKDQLRLNIMTLDEEPAVIMLCIMYNNTYNALTIGVSFQMMQKFPWFNFTYHSVIHNIARAIHEGCDVFDALGGHNEYKYKLGAVDQAGVKYIIDPKGKNTAS